VFKTIIFLVKGNYSPDIENETAFRVCRRLLTENMDDSTKLVEISDNSYFTIKDISAYGDYKIYVFINGIVFITYKSIKELARILLNQNNFSFIAPVSNESEVSAQKLAPPYLYQTISVFKWVVDDIYKKFKDEIIEADNIDNFCFVCNKHVLDNFSSNVTIFDLASKAKNIGLRNGIAKGIYSHRYGNVYESGREDLLKYINEEVRKVLDIGCARGLFGELLKKRQKCNVTGVEFDKALADFAYTRLDKVIIGDIEEIIDENKLDVYDCIVCGDILEHLKDPWRLLKSLRSNLIKGGTIIASVPNINNWAIIYEMLMGRWDYVPFSILSGTHIRFFTRQTLIEMFMDAGYLVENVFYQSIGVHPRGNEFIKRMLKLESKLKVEELQASEIVIIARNV